MKRTLAYSAALIAMMGTAHAGDDTDITQIVNGVQTALNSITVAHNNVNVEQTAVNAENLISMEGRTVDDVVQKANNTTQDARNSATTTFGAWTDLVQGATNIANSLNVGTVATIDQNATGTQYASNYTSFAAYPHAGDAVLNVSSQTATNVGNMATAVTLGETSYQYANINQDAINTAAWNGQTQPSAHLAGSVAEFDQSAVNAVNLLTVTNFPSTSGVLEINQLATANQYASNSLPGNGFLTDVSQVAQNVANSVGLPSVE